MGKQASMFRVYVRWEKGGRPDEGWVVLDDKPGGPEPVLTQRKLPLKVKAIEQALDWVRENRKGYTILLNYKGLELTG